MPLCRAVDWCRSIPRLRLLRHQARVGLRTLAVSVARTTPRWVCRNLSLLIAAGD
jgi:hypothetical protein